MNKPIEYILIAVLAILTLLVFSEPGPVWLFPLFLVLFLFRNPVRGVISRLVPRLSVKYLLAGVIAGLFIEFLAILNQMPLPPEQRALFHPEPVPDLILGIGYYAAIILGTYFILRRYEFSLKQFFILGGVFGIIAEQLGAVLLQVLGGNVLAGIYVFLSYGSFLTLPYMLFEEDFNRTKRRRAGFSKYLIALLILGLSFALFVLYFLLVNPIVSS